MILCDRLRKSQNPIVFGFGNIEGGLINVPFGDFAISMINPRTGRPLTDSYGNTLCAPVVAVSPEGEDIVFGDTFLKSAYDVFRLDEKYFYLGQASHSPKSNVVVIGGMSSGKIASVTGTAEAKATATVRPGNGNFYSYKSATAVPSGFSFTDHSYVPSGTQIANAGSSDAAGGGAAASSSSS